MQTIEGQKELLASGRRLGSDDFLLTRLTLKEVTQEEEETRGGNLLTRH